MTTSPNLVRTTLVALAAALSLTLALLVKQSALLVLLPPALWAFVQALRHPRRRWQALAGLLLVLLLLLPWLHHNWITTLGGTERAVVTSGGWMSQAVSLGWIRLRTSAERCSRAPSWWPSQRRRPPL